jgi:hypothetical protein
MNTCRTHSCFRNGHDHCSFLRDSDNDAIRWQHLPEHLRGWRLAISEQAGNENPPPVRVLGESLTIPAMIGDGPGRQVTESEQGEGDAGP